MLRPAEAAALARASGAVVAVGDDGRIAFATPEALRLLGWSTNLVGEPLSALVPERLRDRHHHRYEHFVLSPRKELGYPKVQPARGEDGLEHPVQVDILAFQRPDSSLFLCSALAAADGEPPSLGLVHSDLAARGYRLLAAGLS